MNIGDAINKEPLPLNEKIRNIIDRWYNDLALNLVINFLSTVNSIYLNFIFCVIVISIRLFFFLALALLLISMGWKLPYPDADNLLGLIPCLIKNLKTESALFVDNSQLSL